MADGEEVRAVGDTGAVDLDILESDAGEELSPPSPTDPNLSVPPSPPSLVPGSEVESQPTSSLDEDGIDYGAWAGDLVARGVQPILGPDKATLTRRLREVWTKEEVDRMVWTLQGELARQNPLVGREAVRGIAYTAMDERYWAMSPQERAWRVAAIQVAEREEAAAADREQAEREAAKEREESARLEGEDGNEEEVIARIEAAATNLLRDILWVYENLGNARVKRRHAPGGGAWWLLEHTRKSEKNKDRFANGLLVRALKVKEDQERRKGGDWEDGRDTGLDEVERMLDEIEKQKSGEVEDEDEEGDV